MMIVGAKLKEREIKMSKLSRNEFERIMENMQTAINKANGRIEKLEKMHHRCSNCGNGRIKDFVYGYCNCDDEPIDPDGFCEKWKEK